MKIINSVRVLLIFALCLWSSIVFARVICVDSNATPISVPNGSCWQNPYTDLEQALQAARTDASIKQIWIADGIYKPSRTYTPKDANGNEVVAGAISLPQYNPGITENGELKSYSDNVESFNQHLKTFEMVNGVDIYGGFQGQSHPSGGEKSINDRDKNIYQNQTILDGDLDGIPSTPDNVWHVVSAGNDLTLEGVKAKLDRLLIRNGNSIEAPYYPLNFPLDAGQVPIHYHDDGGGLYIFTKSKIELNDMVFENNTGVAGGAIFAHDGTQLTINKSIFKNNHSDNGGAITIRSGGPNELNNISDRVSTLKITNSIFTNNNGLYGLSIAAYDSQNDPPAAFAGVNMTITNSYFGQHENEVGWATVALYRGNAVFNKVKFEGNHIQFSGAIDCFSGNVSINHSTFINNSAEVGGAVWLYECEGKIKKSIFQNNKASFGGGAIFIYPVGSYDIQNNQFISNKADVFGGAILNDGGGVINKLIGNEFEGNQAGTTGGAIMNSISNGSKIENMLHNTFINNTPNDIADQ